ncbi:MAG: undecaprenyl-phosphate galactose phosphotransferase WbaP [Treponema sp.]|jgi:Undecaprenyl-phosphate galactose phosphotransferase WbaP|nr:undecaprenyl-phosphate galactose phosphotransferase WbaP [Treponema sp.]
MDLDAFDSWYRARYQRTSSALISTMIIISDLVGVMLSFGTGFFLVNLYDIHAINFRSFVTYWPYLPIFILIFQIMHLYPGLSLAPAEELRHLMIGSLMAHGGIIFSRYIEDEEFDAISIAFIISFIFSTVILLICRSYMHGMLRKSRLGGIPAVIYGGGNMGRLIVDRLLNNKKTGYVPVLILDDDPAAGNLYRDIPIIHDTMIGPEIVNRYNIKMAIVAMPAFEQKRLTQILNYSVSAFRYNVLIPDFFNVSNIWMSIRDFDGILGFVTSHKLKMPWNLGIKRFMDLFITILGGITLLPLLLIIALLVKISSPGPVLYVQQRIGQNGEKFDMYKFRSMVIDAENTLKKLLKDSPDLRREYEIHRKLKNDPRITKIGKILRKTSLDEFPQLINVLKGEMSLVGPRPILEEELPKYGEAFKRNYSVKPGLTGLWQISGRSDLDMDFFKAHISFDTYYLQSWSVWLDLWIFYKTVGVVLKGKGAY